MQENKNSGKDLIREASTEDIPGMLEVFNYYVENSFASYLENSVGPEFFSLSRVKRPDRDDHFHLCD